MNAQLQSSGTRNVDDPPVDASALRTLPLLIQARPGERDLLEFAAHEQPRISKLVQLFGAVLFRGFEVTQEVFGRLADGLWGQRLDYVYRSTPRREVGEKLFTATLYPPDRVIPMHSEESYQRSWPLKLAFFCQQASMAGGETLLVDIVQATQRLDPQIVSRFRERGVRYVRNYIEGVDLSWQDVFQTRSRRDVEQFCARNEIEFVWDAEGNLRTAQICQGTAIHPQLGLEVLFNQAHLFHASSLGEQLEGQMLEVFGLENLPRNATYGDGSAIDRADLAAVRTVLTDAAVGVRWVAGDVLLIDNMRVAHGRASFMGKRVVTVAMGQHYAPVVAAGASS